MAYTRKEYTPEERAAYNAQKQAEMDELAQQYADEDEEP